MFNEGRVQRKLCKDTASRKQQHTIAHIHQQTRNPLKQQPANFKLLPKRHTTMDLTLSVPSPRCGPQASAQTIIIRHVMSVTLTDSQHLETEGTALQPLFYRFHTLDPEEAAVALCIDALCGAAGNAATVAERAVPSDRTVRNGLRPLLVSFENIVLQWRLVEWLVGSWT